MRSETLTSSSVILYYSIAVASLLRQVYPRSSRQP